MFSCMCVGYRKETSSRMTRQRIAKALLEKYGSGELTIKDFSDQTEAMKQMKLRGHDRAQKRQERAAASERTGSRQIVEWCVSRALPVIQEQFESRKHKRGAKPQWYWLLQDVSHEDLRTSHPYHR